MPLKNVPLWAYAIIVLSFVLLACYLAFRDEHQRALVADAGKQQREFLAQRLTQLLKEAADGDFGAVPIGGGGALVRSLDQQPSRASAEFPRGSLGCAFVKRYENDGNRAVSRGFE